MASFSGFYRAVHGRPPFPWQERLAEQVLKGKWPDTIAVPTGCGKTSVIDIAVFSLAGQAGLPARARTAPIRIFFVVDRRLVVDDVSRHAEKIAKAVEEGTAEDLVWVRNELRRFRGCDTCRTGGSHQPDVPTGGYLLQTAILRGGMYRSNTWADAPNQPLVCVSTVDQVGSRLLFRGYGVSDARRPVDAGLVGNDSLIIVDEAHLSRPFLDTVEWVRRYQEDSWLEERAAPVLQFVQMSATVKEQGKTFRLEAPDFEPEALGSRLSAEKIAELKECVNLPQAAAEEAVKLADAGVGVMGVILNTVAVARAVFEALKSQGRDCILLTGRIRPYDRDRLLEENLDRMKAGRVRKEGEQFFVVATQTVEVGADLDFDALVTEAASLDALRQRFGRVNRLGALRGARCVILKPKRAKERDWVYRDALEHTWTWLNEHATDGSIDFGVAKMGELFTGSGNEDLIIPTEEGPLLFPAHLDAWAQTNPAPAADPDVAPFLHGAEALETTDVQIVWRADLEDVSVGQWAMVLEEAPTLSTEALPVPIWAARRWLKGGVLPVADVEGVVPVMEDNPDTGARTFLIWRGPNKSTTQLGELRPGDTVVVRASEGGCDEYGWAPGSAAAVRDIGDLCANRRASEGGGKFRIRAHPRVLFPREEDAELRNQLSDVLQNIASDEDGAIEELEQLVGTAASTQPDLKVPDGAIPWGKAKQYGPADRGWLIGESGWRPAAKKSASVPEMDEADEDDSSSLTELRTLRVHTGGVVAKVRQFAEGCGLSEPVKTTLIAAAERHDLGKWDERFQYLLDPTRDPVLEPLAKGGGCSKAEFQRRRNEAGYPKGARHEFGSVALAAGLSAWPEGCDTELALYLIGSHHGYGRPFAPVWAEADENYAIRAQVEGREVAVRGVHRVASLDSGWADRYWALTRKYGWWGLAYLEAILRRGDCVRSREEQEAFDESD
jgi:CRISPR-associated endonuclease/helicase Cas3